MANTVIGSTIVVEGDIVGDEALLIQGTVKGRVNLKDSLIIDAGAIVDADIETENIEVTGQVNGNITASHMVELKNQCKVVGDIKAPRIRIGDGASFRGAVDMDV